MPGWNKQILPTAEQMLSADISEFSTPSGGMFKLTDIDRKVHGLWRYRNMLPIVDNRNMITLGEGFTPMLNIELETGTALIKQEQLFPTGSYKDRGASVMLSSARQAGITHVVQDSSGNAGCAVAAYAAAAGIACDIYVPANTSPAKLAQIRWYGATLHLIEGTREQTAAAALAASRESWYASHCYNPLFFQGTKTFAYEVCEQLGWAAPDAVVLPAGNGTLVIGCYLGFSELLYSGIIPKMPALIAVQSENCAPLAKAFHSGMRDVTQVETNETLAEGIAIAQPVRARQILEFVRASNGSFITVTETEIEAALTWCARKGFYIEPTSAATIAALVKYLPHAEGKKVVSLFSGHGLKATEKFLKLAKQTH